MINDVNHPPVISLPLSVEQAFKNLMKTTAGQELAQACYYEWDILSAAQRYQTSEEWDAILGLLTRYKPPGINAVDLGAGNGIASYALACAGFTVLAVEPDPSGLVGYGGLLRMVELTDLPIAHSVGFGEDLDLANESFDLVYVRQVLHHAQDLNRMISEIARVLAPGGILLATREHVVDDDHSRQIFLENHPIHWYTGGEGAFTLSEYRSALLRAGLTIVKQLGPWDSVINHYPVSNADVRRQLESLYRKRYGRFARFFGESSWLEQRYRRRRSKQDRSPGRMYSFVAVK